ncbi:MAG: hypothetical protein JWR10_434 [Rubritepida sp.]|nr:hypothetical protein [Rubritepida sp.]
MSDVSEREGAPAAPSSITEADVFAALFAGAHGRGPATAADRQIGERMRAHADRLGWALLPKDRH